jgi:hypothetical protein
MTDYEPTAKQEQAIREYLHEAVIPLIEDVLVKKLGQAMSFCSKELISTEAEKHQDEILKASMRSLKEKNT